MASLSLKGVQKIYPNGFHAVKDFNLEIADKEFIIFVGPSGCGKSTTLQYDRWSWKRFLRRSIHKSADRVSERRRTERP